jgi:hypothetical protein
MPRLPPGSTGILHSALFTRTQSSVDEGPAFDFFLNTLHRVLLFFLFLRGPWRSQILRPIRRFSPLAEDLHLGIERRFPAPINLSIQALMEDKIDHPRPWKIDRISLIGLLVQFLSNQYAVLYSLFIMNISSFRAAGFVARVKGSVWHFLEYTGRSGSLFLPSHREL